MKPSIEERMQSATDKSDGGSCWTWKGCCDRDGYGVLTYRRKQYKAHRMAYMLAHGVAVLSPAVSVCHSCDNPRCVNPAHLFAGSNQDNVDDMIRKGRKRSLRGEAHQNSKLTDDMVRAMRAARIDGASYYSIARQFGVSFRATYSAVNRQTWSHVE